MKSEYIKAAAQASLDVQTDFEDLDVTKIKASIKTIEGAKWLVLAVKGTDPTWKDWSRNFKMFKTKDNIKNHAWVAAERIALNNLQDFNLPILVTCHSQGVEGLAYYLQFCNLETDKIVMFAPPPILTKTVRLNNALIVVNDRDVVPYAGAGKFDHPVCETIYFNSKGKAFYDLTMSQIFWRSTWRCWKVKERGGDHGMKNYYNLINKL